MKTNKKVLGRLRAWAGDAYLLLEYMRLVIVFYLVIFVNVHIWHGGDTSYVERCMMDAGFKRSLEGGQRVYRDCSGKVLYRVK